MNEFKIDDRVKVCIVPSLGEAGIEYGKIIDIAKETDRDYFKKNKYLIEFDDIDYISTCYSAEELELL